MKPVIKKRSFIFINETGTRAKILGGFYEVK
jgi:hypothetical protein